MTQLTDVMDILPIEIKSLQEVVRESPQPYQYKRWFEREKRIIESGQAPSLPAYILYEYQFNEKSIQDLRRIVGVPYNTLRSMMIAMNIPFKTKSEAFARNCTDDDLLLELVREEIEQFKQGKIDSLSSNDELRQMAGMGEGTFQKCLRGLIRKERHERRSFLASEVSMRDLLALAQIVKQEVKEYTLGRRDKISGNPELADLIGVSEQSDFARFLRRVLTPDERKLRKHILCHEAREGSIRKKDVIALVELVKDEIELNKQGKLETLTGNKKLADLLGVSKAVCGYLRKYLSKEDADYRKKAIFSKRASETIERCGSALGSFKPEDRKRYCSDAGKENYRLHGNPAKDISPERRKEIGNKVYREHGPPMLKLTRARRKELARKRTDTYGCGWDKLTVEEKAAAQEKAKKVSRITSKALGRRAVELHRKNAYNVESRFYASSQQEGAVALLLERYFPGFRVEEGRSFQVTSGVNNGGIDFRVNGKFLEWHPIVLYPKSSKRGDIPTEEFGGYQKALLSLPDEERPDFKRDFARTLTLRYQSARQGAVDPAIYPDTAVVVVGSDRELYTFLAGYGINLPTLPDFRREFRDNIEYVKSFKVQQKEKLAGLVEAGR